MNGQQQWLNILTTVIGVFCTVVWYLISGIW
jgi:hypothetical protein